MTGQEERAGQEEWKWVPDAEDSADVAAVEVVAFGGAAAGRQAAGLPTAAAAAVAAAKQKNKCNGEVKKARFSQQLWFISVIK